ncbi:hypothetical protein J4476_00325, partial [Candidatus Woesearchaeota archaeon]|nr:hypothetical protein [Candidatus Woesearchaeota archaeon]
INKKKVSVLIFLVILLTVIIVINTPSNCKSDYYCFNDHVLDCSKAKVITEKDDNTYYYEVLSKKDDNCIIKVQLNKLSNSQSNDLKKALEGKNMLCSIPSSTLEVKDIKSITNLNDYCSGQLKEAVLEVTIQKLYDVVVENIGPIAAELRNSTRI